MNFLNNITDDVMLKSCPEEVDAISSIAKDIQKLGDCNEANG